MFTGPKNSGEAPPTAARAVAPGGTLLVVAHDSTNLTEGVGGPQDASVLFKPEQALHGVNGLDLHTVTARRVFRQVQRRNETGTAVDAPRRAPPAGDRGTEPIAQSQSGDTMSGYGMSVSVDAPMDQVLDRTRAALADQGFGILTEIDVAATMKAKLDVDVPPQIILGACNAPLARQGLQIEPDLGLLLPSNVVVRKDDTGRTLVSALDPELMVRVPGKPDLQPIADDARARLRAVLDSLTD